MNKIKTLALAVAALSAANSQAIEFNAGPVSGQLNTSISYGIGFRTEDPDLKQVHPMNANTALGTNFSPAGGTQTGSTYNYDDGTLNYEKNDVITNVVKGNIDLELVWDDFGAFVRGSAFYDTVIMDEDPNFKPYIDETKDSAGSGYDLLDAFVWYNGYLGDTPASLRLGRQVVSWGESTFILGGINSINPVNASAIRKPGVEGKEVLLPVNMAYGSFGLTDNVTLEAFYQLEWEKTRPDGCGTFFSTTELIADGCGPVFLGGVTDELVIAENSITSSQLITPRVTPDDEPSDDGQFGLALRWYSEELGDTEFGLYHMNIHSRLPLISGEASGGANGATPKYQIVYPEDIKLTGLSFSRGTESGWSIGGEISMKQDVPFQWNAFELILGGLRNPGSLLLQQIIAPIVADGITSEADAIASLGGQAFDGYDRFDVYQAQMTFIKFFDQVLGASRLSFVSEIGATYVPDLPGLDEARYGRSGAYGIGTIPDSTVSTGDLCTAPTLADGTTTNTARNLNSDYCTNDGYVDELSYGIRARASLDYPNALLGANLKPQLSIGLDEGTAPEPGGAFVDGRIKTDIALNFDYLNAYSGGIAYTMYEGSKYDQLKDRDNVSLNLKVTF